MDHPLIKISTAFALGAVVLACPAHAVSPVALDKTSSFLIPVADEANEELMREMEPGVTTPEAGAGAKEEAPPAAQPERPKEEGKGSEDMEEEAFKEDGMIPE